MNHILVIFFWLIEVELISLLTFPIVKTFFYNLKDKGYVLSKILSLVLLTFFVNIISFTNIGYKNITILLYLGFLLLVSIFLILKNPNSFNFLKDKNFIEEIFIIEKIFIISFIFFTFIRSFTSDIYGAEKWSDFLILNSISRSEKFPPQYGWFSGGDMRRYYYFGQLIFSILTLISKIPSSITYNLAISTLFSLSLIGCYSILVNLTQKRKCGILAALFVCIIGNFFPLLQIINYFLPQIDMKVENYPIPIQGSFFEKLLRFDWWVSTRIIPGTINEFPYFSFLFGDLHAHMIAIPFQIGLILMLISLYKSNDEDFYFVIIKMIILSIFIGFFMPLNTWSYPTSLAFSIGIFFIKDIDTIKKFKWAKIKNLIFIIILVLILSLSLYFTNFDLLKTNNENRNLKLSNERTTLYHFSLIFHIFIFIIITFLILLLKLYNKSKYKISKIIFLFFGTILLSIILDFQLLILLPILAICIYLILLNKTKEEEKFVLFLIIFGAILALICEILYIDSRYNTVFKFYIQIWVFWGIASSYCVYRIEEYLNREKNGYMKKIWKSIYIFLILVALIYPVLSTISITGGFSRKSTIDGLEYLKERNPEEYEAIQWLNKIEGTPVILETPGEVYTDTSRISANTGLPTVIGWASRVWHYLSIDWGTINSRVKDVDEIYNTVDNEKALNLLKKYNVSFIYIGPLEYTDYYAYGGKLLHKAYSSEGLKKFDTFTKNYELVFKNSKVKIFKVIPN